MKRLIVFLLTAAAIMTLIGCAKTQSGSASESSSIRVYGNGNYSKALEETSDIIVMVSNRSNIDRVKMHGMLNDVEIFNGKYSKEKIVKQAGGYTTDHQISYYYVTTDDEEYSFYVEAGTVFYRESISPEDNEQVWILFSYSQNDNNEEDVHAMVSYSSFGFV